MMKLLIIFAPMVFATLYAIHSCIQEYDNPDDLQAACDWAHTVVWGCGIVSLILIGLFSDG